MHLKYAPELSFRADRVVQRGGADRGPAREPSGSTLERQREDDDGAG